ISMPGSRPLPVRSFEARSTRNCTNLSATDSSMTTRLVAVQRWPVDAKAPKTVDSTARGRSASARITSGFLPPISHWHFFMRRAPCAYSSLPTSFEPERNRAHIGVLQQFVAYLTAGADDHVGDELLQHPDVRAI